jgi:putative alpha-1,2-mannosidase
VLLLGSLSSTVQIRVGLSFISTEQAKLNLNEVDKSKSFDQLQSATRQVWCDALSGFTFTPLDGDNDIETMLFSANYRAHLSPTIYTESGGVYLGLDKTVHNAIDERNTQYATSNAKSSKTMEFYSDLSLWDTFRRFLCTCIAYLSHLITGFIGICSLHPWLLLTDEPLAIGILRSISEMTQQQQGYPKWVLANVDIGCMVGLHGASLALEAALSGLAAEFDVVGIQEMLLNQATLPWPRNGRKDLDHYLSAGYVSDEADDASPALTLTYAYDDFLVGGLSAFVGNTTAAEEAFARAQNYRNVWSAENDFTCPRSVNGELNCPKSGTSPEAWQHYIEGNTLHWSTFVIQDPVGLLSLYESVDEFNDKMESFFHNHLPYHSLYGSALPNPYYW